MKIKLLHRIWHEFQTSFNRSHSLTIIANQSAAYPLPCLQAAVRSFNQSIGLIIIIIRKIDAISAMISPIAFDLKQRVAHLIFPWIRPKLRAQTLLLPAIKMRIDGESSDSIRTLDQNEEKESRSPVNRAQLQCRAVERHCCREARSS